MIDKLIVALAKAGAQVVLWQRTNSTGILAFAGTTKEGAVVTDLAEAQ